MDASAIPHARRNWLAHASEGGFFIGGMAFVSSQTLLPTIIQNLGGAEWMVTLAPVLMLIGLQLPQAFTAHLVGRMGHFMPALLVNGIFQRVTFLIAGLILIYGDAPMVAVWAVVLAPFLSGLAGGVLITGWQQLIARTVPPQRRASLFAARMIMGSLLGVAAGHVVEQVLADHPGAHGYGILHLWAFAGLTLSYICFMFIREPAVPATAEPRSGLWQNIRSLPGHLTADRRILLFLTSTSLYALAGLFIPYFAIHARHVTGLPMSFLGELVAWQMTGAIIGNVIAGWAGDHHGGKATMITARVLLLGICIAAPCATSAAAWHWLFLIFGAVYNANMVGTSTMQLELLPKRGRANVLSIMGFCNLPASLIAAMIGATWWSHAGDAAFVWLAAASGVCLLLSLMAVVTVKEPRIAVDET
ncbi:MAG: hypothetical protein AAB263_02505 [Planctomycetota bacterium]